MKCPACFNELTPFQVRNLTVDVCQGGCGGVWFDAFELQKVDEERETAGEPLLNIQRDERLIVDKSRKRECPRCAGVKLHRHFFSAKRRVEVDECPGCVTYPKFVSRSTGYRCWDCGKNFIYYAKNYGIDREINNNLVAAK